MMATDDDHVELRRSSSMMNGFLFGATITTDDYARNATSTTGAPVMATNSCGDKLNTACG